MDVVEKRFPDLVFSRDEINKEIFRSINDPVLVPSTRAKSKKQFRNFKISAIMKHRSTKSDENIRELNQKLLNRS